MTITINNLNCLICYRINQIKENSNPYFILELKTGYVVFADYQFYKGYVIFLCKKHKAELHELDSDYKKNFLMEMGLVAEAVFKTFRPIKINYELLGNKDFHLHWHIIPRYNSDFNLHQPIWSIDASIRNSEEFCPSQKELKEMKKEFIKEFNKLL